MTGFQRACQRGVALSSTLPDIKMIADRLAQTCNGRVNLTVDDRSAIGQPGTGKGLAIASAFEELRAAGFQHITVFANGTTYERN